MAGGSVALVKTIGRTPTGPITGCEVTAGPPLNDRAFNQAVFDGLTDAATTWGISVLDKVSEPSDPGVWARHIREFVRQRCSLIVTIGGGMADLTVAAGKANPSQRFAVTDYYEARTLPNLLRVVFHPDQAAFQAGYLAAGMTKTGTVATFGGIPIATVIPFMKGFAAGVLYYNQANGTNVRLLGWDPKNQTGTFVGQDPTDFNVFGDPAGARGITAQLISAGADIVMPVDGTVGEDGAGQAAGRAGKVLLIGVDTDQFFSTPQYEALWLTSVVKSYRRMVYAAMGEIDHGAFRGGVLDGTLANGGVALAPLHQLGERVPSSLLTALNQIKGGIADGSISVDPTSYPGA